MCILRATLMAYYINLSTATNIESNAMLFIYEWMNEWMNEWVTVYPYSERRAIRILPCTPLSPTLLGQWVYTVKHNAYKVYLRVTLYYVILETYSTLYLSLSRSREYFYKIVLELARTSQNTYFTVIFKWSWSHYLYGYFYNNCPQLTLLRPVIDCW